MQNFKIDFKFKVKAVGKNNGYGNVRSNQTIPYGTYKHLAGVSGVYCIKNKINNMMYIGSTRDAQRRVLKHFSLLRNNKHPNLLLQGDYNKYGYNEFEIQMLEECDDILDKEVEHQLKYSLEMLYNQEITGNYHSDRQRKAWTNNNRSVHKTKEYREKMSKLKQNKIGQFTKDGSKLIAIYNNSDEVCEKFKMAKSSLLGCCNGSKKSIFGYKWHYLDDNGRIIAQGIGRYRTIIRNEEIV